MGFYGRFARFVRGDWRASRIRRSAECVRARTGHPFSHASVLSPSARVAFPLSEANRRCKPRHVLQRPPENNTCLHTASSHSALPRSELVPSLAHVAAVAATREFAPSSVLFDVADRILHSPHRHEGDVSRVLSRRRKSLSAVGVIANLWRSEWVPSKAVNSLLFS